MFNYTPKENQTKEKKGDKKRKRFGGVERGVGRRFQKLNVKKILNYRFRQIKGKKVTFIKEILNVTFKNEING